MLEFERSKVTPVGRDEVIFDSLTAKTDNGQDDAPYSWLKTEPSPPPIDVRPPTANELANLGRQVETMTSTVATLEQASNESPAQTKAATWKLAKAKFAESASALDVAFSSASDTDSKIVLVDKESVNTLVPSLSSNIGWKRAKERAVLPGDCLD